MINKSYLLLLLSVILVGCNNNHNITDNFLSTIDQNQSYLFFRGTDSKEGIISSNFSMYDNTLSHVGIGIYENHKWKIYNVINSNTDNDLLIESLYSFYNKETLNINSIEIYKIDLDEDEIDKVRKIVLQFSSRKIVFNKRFEKGDSTKLYCSEFVVKILGKLDSSKFKYSKETVKLPQLYSKLLAKDSLAYFPVDMFICSKYFSPVYKESY